MVYPDFHTLRSKGAKNLIIYVRLKKTGLRCLLGQCSEYYFPFFLFHVSV